MSPALLRRAASIATLSMLALACASHAAPTPADDESDLPLSLRSGYVDPIIGPANSTAYARGALGLVRTSFGKSSLFAAWRVMQLPVGALDKESHERTGDWLNGPDKPQPKDDAIDTWLAARAEVAPKPPATKPDYFRPTPVKSDGQPDYSSAEGQCGPDAFRFATTTLRELVADTALSDGDRRGWVAGQDAVFARCTWTPGKVPAPALPATLAARAPAKMKSLNAYQRAAALFYGDEFVEARKAFDAIAAVPADPMRPHAALGAYRSVLRDAVLDAEWSKAVDDAWRRRGLRDAAFSAAVADAAARHHVRTTTLLKDLEARTIAIRNDASLARVHEAVAYTARRALMQLVPQVPLQMAMEAMGRPEYNPYSRSATDLFRDLYPKEHPHRPQGAAAANLRKHLWFDFVVTVQGCAPTVEGVRFDPAVCDAEHAHALERWQETRHNAWLLAVLMTAREPSAADLPAAEAALAVSVSRPEWGSLQFYAARVLAAQKRTPDAKRALDALIASNVLHKRDRPLAVAARQSL